MSTGVELLSKLRELFPQQSLNYLKLVAAYYKNDAASFTVFVTSVMASYPHQFPPLPERRDEELEVYLGNQLQFLRELLPDAEEVYLQGLFEDYAGSRNMEAVALDALESQSYPKKEAPKEKEVKFDVKLYCQLVPNPLDSFSHSNYIMTENMRAEATDYLVRIFGEQKRAEISSLVKKEESLYLAFKKMRKFSVQHCIKVLKTPQPKTFDEFPDYKQTFEKLFIENEEVILSYLKKKHSDEEELYKLEERSGSLQECEICCGFTPSFKMVKICEGDHKMCVNCVKEHSELLFHQSILFFPCTYEGCKRYLSKAVIRSVWDTSRYSKLLEDRRFSNKENGIACPFCNFFNDQSTSQEILCVHCLKKFCVSCKKNAHSPFDCDKKENDLCKLIEETMTNTLVRTCPNCQTPFIKEPSCCNRVHCTKCNANICYICRKIVSGQNYSHFYGQGTMPSEAPGLCPLHSDSNDLHVYRVIDSGKKALEKIKAENPHVELKYNPLDVLPVAGKSDAVPNQF